MRLGLERVVRRVVAQDVALWPCVRVAPLVHGAGMHARSRVPWITTGRDGHEDHGFDENSSKKSFLRAELKVGGLSLVVGRMREHKTKAV